MSVEGFMEDVQLKRRELKVMQDNIYRSVNALELCWACDRICECKQWIINREIRWICRECLS